MEIDPNRFDTVRMRRDERGMLRSWFSRGLGLDRRRSRRVDASRPNARDASIGSSRYRVELSESTILKA